MERTLGSCGAKERVLRQVKKGDADENAQNVNNTKNMSE